MKTQVRCQKRSLGSLSALRPETKIPLVPRAGVHSQIPSAPRSCTGDALHQPLFTTASTVDFKFQKVTFLKKSLSSRDGLKGNVGF